MPILLRSEVSEVYRVYNNTIDNIKRKSNTIDNIKTKSEGRKRSLLCGFGLGASQNIAGVPVGM